jgi:signal recognition particle subunit SEC65
VISDMSTIPREITVANPVAATREQSIRELGIDPARFMPADQMRPWARTAAAEVTINLAQMVVVPDAST